MDNSQAAKTKLKGVLFLLMASFIWGSSFVAQSVGMKNVEAFTFTAVRSILGSLVLLPIIFISDAISGRRLDTTQKSERKAKSKRSVLYGALLGIVLCAATNLQQFAFYDTETSSGKIAFITALYMFFVPIFGLFSGKRLSMITWVSVIIGFSGLFFLCADFKELANIRTSDLLTLACSLFLALHIILIEQFATKVDGLKLSCIQCAVSGIISLVLMFIFETPSITSIKSAYVPILYSGILSCGIAYTFQIIGQKHTEATVASLIMCMEAVFGVVCGALILHERMSGNEIVGCILMFVAIILSQVADKISATIKKRKHKCTGEKKE